MGKMATEVTVPTDPPVVEGPYLVPASDLKKRGWRGIMRTVQERGTVVVTNHDRAEAVILGVREYEALRTKAAEADARAESELDLLRLQFDERLKALRAPDAGKKLRSMMRGSAKLSGKVKAGAGY